MKIERYEVGQSYPCVDEETYFKIIAFYGPGISWMFVGPQFDTGEECEAAIKELEKLYPLPVDAETIMNHFNKGLIE